MTRNELKKRITKDRKLFRDRLRALKKYSTESEAYKRIMSDYARLMRTRITKSVSNTEIQKIYNDLEYIKSLSSSSAKNIRQGERRYFIKIVEYLKEQDPAYFRKFNEIYKKAVEQNQILQLFRYETKNVLFDMMFASDNTQFTEDDVLNEEVETILFTALDELAGKISKGEISKIITPKRFRF